MNLLVNIPDGVGYHKRKAGLGTFLRYERMKKIETMVYRIERMDRDVGPPRIRVDAWIPEHHRDGFLPGDLNWVGDGIYRTYAYLQDNRTTLGPFLASGDKEWVLGGSGT
ncbi:hypothetical protein AAGS40_23345 [Paraburkholderia sp. PREW-6R]|uniref:hypothetical protein n=1 Tax=Paraburkholderia sp. PREW-6R TaxID=3141544 RepID=UPI0031F49A3B